MTTAQPLAAQNQIAVKPEVMEEPLGATPASCPLPEPYTITIPSFSGWFSWEEIHEMERRVFDGKSSSRNLSVYKYYRDTILRQFRENPSRKITFTEARRGLIGDVGSILRVFNFLEEWGLINYTPATSAKPNSSSISTSKDKKEVPSENLNKDYAKKFCFNCKAPCSLSCFTTDKADIILCARCFVRGNYRPGLSATDFKRVDISEETKPEWSDKETLHLLEAILQYSEDWKKVADHVGSRNQKECVSRFIKLPFGEQFLGHSEIFEDDNQNKKDDDKLNPGEGSDGEQCFSKQRRLAAFSDASNPILSQVAFLSSVASSHVAQAACDAAITALQKVDAASGSNAVASKRNAYPTSEVLDEAAQEAYAQLEEEEKEMEQCISDVLEVQMKDILDKTKQFEDAELLIEKEKQQMQYMRNLLFADQLDLLQHKALINVKANANANEGRSCFDH